MPTHITVETLIALFDCNMRHRIDLCIDLDWLVSADNEWILDTYGEYEVQQFSIDVEDTTLVLEIHIEEEYDYD